MIGVSTVQECTESRQKKIVAVDGRTETDGVHARALLTPDEILRLPVAKVDEHHRLIEPGSALVFSRGCHPIHAVQTPWFFDDEMTARAHIPAPAHSDRLYELSA